MFDLIIANARVAGHDGTVDIGVRDGRIAAIEASLAADAPREDVCGCFAFSGFVDSHIHLDKACILDRCIICEGTLQEAVRETGKAKAAFTFSSSSSSSMIRSRHADNPSPRPRP